MATAALPKPNNIISLLQLTRTLKNNYTVTKKIITIPANSGGGFFNE